MLNTIIRALICVSLLALGSRSAIAQSVALPGTIQAEDFDQGGAAIAYLDSTPGNSGGQYRATDVDIEPATDTGGGHNVGWIAAGEWLRYTVNVSAAGNYDIEVRVASEMSGGRFHIEVNGVDKTGPLTIPGTGNWQAWTTIRRNGVSLSAGQQTWRLVMDAGGATGSVGNINYIRVTGPVASGPLPVPYTGTPAALPGTLQVEDFDNGGEGVAYHDLSIGNDGGQYRSTGVDVAATSDAGGGYNLGYTAAGEWLSYTVNVGAAGTYDIEVRVASNGRGGTFHIEVNGADRTGPFTIPDTAGWQTWVTIRKTGLTLAAGLQVWRIVMDADGDTGAVGNFNHVRIVTTQGAGGSMPFNGTPAVLPGVMQAEDFDIGGEGVAFHDLSASNEGAEYRGPGVDIQRTTDTGGGFNVGWTRAGEWLAYTVNVAAAGTYDIEARVASAGSGGRFHVEVNGVDRTGSFTVPDTGGWQSWITLRKTGLTLSAGRQTWRVVMDANGASGAITNLNYVRVVGATGSTPPPPEPAGLPAPWVNQDIGNPSVRGASSFANGVFTVSGAGDDIWSTSDQFQYTYQPMQGDVEVIARVDFLQGPDTWSKAGIMIRQNLTAGSPNVLVAATVANGWTYQRRRIADDVSYGSGSARLPGAAPGWVRLVRQGHVFNGYYSADGSSWTLFNSDTISMSSGAYVGLAVTSHNAGAHATASFSNFTIRPLATSNQPPTSTITTPGSGAAYTAPATITINAAATDPDGSITRVDFYRGTQLIGSDSSSPYSTIWSSAPAGSYALTAVAFDNLGASTASTAVNITINPAPSNTPTTIVFTPSLDHATDVSSYSVAVYRASDPVTSTPAATGNLGKPAVSNNEISSDISTLVNPLPAGSYYAVVTAIGPGGSAASAPSPTFTK